MYNVLGRYFLSRAVSSVVEDERLDVKKKGSIEK